MRIDELMSQPVATCGINDTLNAAAETMWSRDCGVIPVVNDEGRLVGIVTDRDICMGAYTQGLPLCAIPVATVMTRQVHVCHARDPLETAARIMAEKQVRRLPVVDEEDRPIGLISLNDVTRGAARRKRETAQDRAIVNTLAAVCQPRAAEPVERMSAPG